MKLYAVIGNTDLSEGRGKSFTWHLCENKATALRLGYRRYVMGGDCPIEEIEVEDVVPLKYVPIARATTEDILQEKRLALIEKLGISASELELLRN